MPNTLYTTATVLLARARFLLLVGGLLGVIAGWPILTNYWEKLTRSPQTSGAISADTEYWCPMCPGVVSDWSTKCPVCNMSLVRRLKGEMTPLPDGIVARVQLSPYRIQLAGIRTSPVEYRRLEQEIIIAGLIEATPANVGSVARLVLNGDVFERDAALLKLDQEIRVWCDATQGEPTLGRIAQLTSLTSATGGKRVLVHVENPRGDLRPGLFASAKYLVPVAHTNTAHRQAYARLQERIALRVIVNPWDGPSTALADGILMQATTHVGLTLAVPESAVIDTGTRHVVYLESMAGIYDAVEVRLGRRCDDYYPVLGGLDPGQRVASAGAVLLDAETRLNPSLAASYFGAGSRGIVSPPLPATPTSPTVDDGILVKRQKICPVTGEPLDSMGGPVRVDLDGRAVFVCCKSCEKPLRKKPAEYLAKLPK